MIGEDGQENGFGLLSNDDSTHRLVLGDLLDEYCHKLKKLEESQRQLIEYLSEDEIDESDSDRKVLRSAVEENVHSIRNMNFAIDKLANGI
jgi:hypothetical protein